MKKDEKLTKLQDVKKKTKKINIDKRTVRNISLIIMLSVLVTLSPKAVKKIKEEKRAHDFYKYIMEEVDRYAATRSAEYDIETFKELYQENPKLEDLYLNSLLQSIDDYTKDMKKNSHLINKYDKTISFEQALELLEQEGYNIIPNKLLLSSTKARTIAQIKAKKLYENEKKSATK